MRAGFEVCQALSFLVCLPLTVRKCVIIGPDLLQRRRITFQQCLSIFLDRLPDFLLRSSIRALSDGLLSSERQQSHGENCDVDDRFHMQTPLQLLNWIEKVSRFQSWSCRGMRARSQ